MKKKFKILHFLSPLIYQNQKCTTIKLIRAVPEISPILDEPEYENLLAHDRTATAEIRITNLDDLETDEKLVQEDHIYFAHVNLIKMKHFHCQHVFSFLFVQQTNIAMIHDHQLRRQISHTFDF